MKNIYNWIIKSRIVKMTADLLTTHCHSLKTGKSINLCSNTAKYWQQVKLVIVKYCSQHYQINRDFFWLNAELQCSHLLLLYGRYLWAWRHWTMSLTVRSFRRYGYLTIIPRARMGSESIAHEAKGRMGYWLKGHGGGRNNCFSKIQLVSN